VLLQLPSHSYEEIRDAVAEVLQGNPGSTGYPNQYGSLVQAVRRVLSTRIHRRSFDDHEMPQLQMEDHELVRDVFWDLFRQGFITLGLDYSNDRWPWFRLSHFGKRALDLSKPFAFHHAQSYVERIQAEIPDVRPETLEYLQEAAAAFYAGCPLASTVMLGVAAECEFERLLDSAVADQQFGSRFQKAKQHQFIRRKISAFSDAIKTLPKSYLPETATEDIDINLNFIQSVLRVARNEAGHPTFSRTITREQVYINLQMFFPFAKQLLRLRSALQGAPSE
jgi:hypothetical protein